MKGNKKSVKLLKSYTVESTTDLKLVPVLADWDNAKNSWATNTKLEFKICTNSLEEESSYL